MTDSEKTSESFEEVLRLNNLISARFAPDNNLQKTLGVSDKVMEGYYASAAQLLEQQRYDAASDAFLFLATLDPFNVEYWLNMGLAEHRRGNEREALKALGMACIVDPESPTPHVYAAECYMKEEDLVHAVDSLRLALEAGLDKEEYAEMKSRVFNLTRIVKHLSM